jgi:hypothetical protein
MVIRLRRSNDANQDANELVTLVGLEHAHAKVERGKWTTRALVGLLDLLLVPNRRQFVSASLSPSRPVPPYNRLETYRVQLGSHIITDDAPNCNLNCGRKMHVKKQ